MKEIHKPKIDVVLQATGSHAHAVGFGIINAISRMGQLGRVFRPKAGWGLVEPDDDDGLFEYLSAPQNEFILFLGFDWHSQALHSTVKWKYRIRSSPCVKIGYFHETISNGTEPERRAKAGAVLSCHSLLDIIWHASEAEAEYIRNLIGNSRPVFASGFGVDTNFFSVKKNPEERKGFAFFRGKLQPFTHSSQYQERRDLINYLQARGLVEVKSYDPNGFSDEDLVAEYNDYLICIDPPSVFDGPTTRVYEALACGCIVFTHKRNFNSETVGDFTPLLNTYSSKESLAENLTEIKQQTITYRSIHSNHHELREKISLERQLERMIDQWLAMLPAVVLDAPVLRLFGHPYHDVTKSHRFILDYFSDLNTVTITCNNHQKALSAYDSPTYNLGCYLEIGWQTIHFYPHFNEDNGTRRFFFPMFDNSNHRSNHEFPSVGTYFNFSKTMHERLKALGRDCRYIRYYPQPLKDAETITYSIDLTARRMKTSSLKAYFWQRTLEINVDTAISICKQTGCSELVINRHHDPGHEYASHKLPPEIDGIKITTHKWLKNKQELFRILDDCDIYIAPRSCEGIGLSFLEAYSRCLCIVAYNAPTMNEYIRDGQNGYLYNSIQQPRLSLGSDPATIRRNILNDYHSLYECWERQLKDVIREMHPFEYSKALKYLKEKGVTFKKRFDFIIPIEHTAHE